MHRLLRHPAATLAFAVAVGVAVSAIFRSHQPATQLSLTPVVAKVLDDPASPRAGAVRPDLVIVVFTDYRCPICRATDPALERLIARDRRVQVVFKDWPIFGPASQSAARLALAAQAQGRYLPAHRALMTAVWTDRPGQLHEIAARAGLDERQAASDLSARAADYDAQLRRHGAQAWSLGVSGTPAYIIGPYLFQGGLDDRQLDRAVKRARRGGWGAIAAEGGT